MSSGKVDTTRTDQHYWDAQLESHNLGMNRGTTFSDDMPSVAVKQDDEKKVSRVGRPRKRGPKGSRSELTKKEAVNAARATVTPDAPGGRFQCGGFRYTNPSKLIGGGRGRKGGQKGFEGKRDFIQYVGSISDLATLEESLDREESGRVRPGGHRPR